MNQTVEQYRVLLTIVSAVVVCYGGCPSTTAAAQEEGLTRVSRPASAEQLRCEQVVLRAARLDEWPQSESLRSAPQVDKSLLLEPDLVTAEHRSCGVVVLDGVECGRLWVDWRRVEPSDAPLPTELPRRRRERMVEAMTRAGRSAEQQNRTLERFLTRYRDSKRTKLAGQMSVKVTVAPSSKAAQEFLIYDSTITSDAPEGVAHQFDEANRVAGLGDVSFKYAGTVKFIRGNVFVAVWGTGVFANQLDAAARELDAAIVGQDPYADLDAFLEARPRVAVGSWQREASAAAYQPVLSVIATPPAGGSIAQIDATLDGEPMPVRNQEVFFGGVAEGEVLLKITAFTDAVLVGSVERMVDVPATDWARSSNSE